MKDKNQKHSKKSKKKEKISLSETITAEMLELLQKLKDNLRKEEHRHTHTKQGIKRLGNNDKKSRKIVRKPK